MVKYACKWFSMLVYVFTAVRGEIPKRMPKAVCMRVQVPRHTEKYVSWLKFVAAATPKTVRESVRERFIKIG